MHDETGKLSAALLTEPEAGRIIDRLKQLQAAVDPGSKPAAGAIRMDGPYAAKLRALWIAGFNLGVVHDRTDRALCAFIERQTGISHPRFLREPADAAKAVEGIKAWLAREAGVRWGRETSDPVELKRAIVFAQHERLRALGADIGPARIWHCGAAQLDQVANARGRQLRAALARQAKEAVR
ncbi:MAG: DUF1018 domain-containing protein [Rhizobiales bacterium]|nr:DUF1018 domain-containing protein [Hyphomicrobiales bacterium]